MSQTEKEPLNPEWDKLPPARLPRPTYCPAGMAMGTVLIFLGIITSWVILLFGSGLFTITLGGWIAEILHERKQH